MWNGSWQMEHAIENSFDYKLWTDHVIEIIPDFKFRHGAQVKTSIQSDGVCVHKSHGI